MSYPFHGKEFVFTQPDGTQIKVRGWGDQQYAVFETLDGYTIVEDPTTGFYCYADLSDDKDDLVSTGVKAGLLDAAELRLEKGIRIRRASAKQKAVAAYRSMGAKRRCDVRRERARSMMRNAMMPGGPHAAPPQQGTKGDYVGLCLLIQFPDVAGTIPHEEVEDYCNKKGYNGYGNNGSVYDYFFDISNGNLRYTNIITLYYTAKYPQPYYANRLIRQGIRARELVKEALSSLKEQGFDFNQLSADDEGYIYAVNVFYAGRCPNNWAEGLWPHSWSLAIPYELSPGRKAYDYQMTDMGNELSIATFCHENGHMVCDYPDLYDYGYESRGIGSYCLMCSGSDEKNPPQVCAYLKYKSGWAKRVTPISGTMEAEISAGDGENDFLIYPKNLIEYFLIENRNREGRDRSLPSSGLAIWHVDELGSNDNEQMTEESHYECSLEQADNRFDLERAANYGDPEDLFKASVNSKFGDSATPDSKWWNGTSSGLAIMDISEADRVMTFRSGVGGSIYRKSSAPDMEIPDFNIAGVRDAIRFSESVTVSSIKVSVDITHAYRGDLQVTLIAPSGSLVVLHSREGGRADDLKTTFDLTTTPELRTLVGQSLKGEWTLHVQDLARSDKGRLNSWELEITGSLDTIVEMTESPGIKIPDNDPTGIERELIADAPGQVKDISVSVDITHTYIRDLVVTLVSPEGTNVNLHNRSGGSSDNIIKTYTSVTTPGLDALRNEQIQGKWKLKVADLEGSDLGKLNQWGIKITR